MKKSHLFFLFLFVLLTTSLFAQLTPEVAVAEMGRGINLGNTLEPPTESAWNNGPAQESYFDAYLDAGFSNIRVPVRWDQHTTNTAPFTINETWMDRVEQVVDWGLSRGFYITLNGHHEDWLKNNYSNPTLRARYDSIWVQVAERFQNKSDKLLFEIINEPNGMTVGQVDDLNQRILDIIRETNPTRIVIYGGNMYANSEQLLNAAIPTDDYLIGYYHAYDPWQFSGQGIGTWGTANDYQQLTNKYQSVKNWSTANNIPIHHSEFGAKLICDFNSRMRIYAHNVEQCIVKGFAFSVWDDGGDFRVLNRGVNSWPEVKDVLMHYYEDSPNQIFSTFSLDPVTDLPMVLVEWNNRAVDNGNIILERSVGASSNFEQIADLPGDATTFTDLDIDAGITYTYRMYTTRTDGTLLHGYPTRVTVTATVQTPFNGDAIPIPGELEVEEYDFGGEGLAYHDTEPANIPGGLRPNEGVDIGAYGSGFILGYVALNEWIEYTVNVSQSGTYTVVAEVASEVVNGAFSITFDKNNASTNFSTPNTGNWTAFQDITSNTEIELEAGEQQMRLNITNGNPFNVDRLIFNLETVSVTDMDAEQAGFKISPNPVSDYFEISSNENVSLLKLFDIQGQLIKRYTPENRYRIPNNLSSGIYILEIENNKGNSFYTKMVKE